MKSTIEIFTAGCPVCEPAVKMVKELSADTDQVILYDLGIEAGIEKNKSKIQEYGINRVPSVVVDGKLLSCCDNEISRKDLLEAGIGGQP
mgnify:CR=1 FL=1